MKEQDDRMSEAERRLEEAAAWRLRMAENEGHGSLEFDLWLRQPANRSAWEQVTAAWGAFEDSREQAEMAPWRAAARADLQKANRRQAPYRVARSLGRIAAALLLVSLAGGSAYWWLNRPDDYRTAAGERRVITLSDGSRMSLDSNSEVTVRYGARQRSLRLLRGQARFDVAHDRSRPFSVIAGNQKVVATGTAFNIDMAGPRVLVTLIEGRVLVFSEEEGDPGQILSHPRIELRAGQQLAASPNSAPKIEPVSIPRVTAWTAGQLIFDNEPLSSVVERLNRYSFTQIVVSDPSLGDRKISGVFNAGDTQRFVTMVTRYFRIRAVTEDANTIVLRSASDP
jgi:transmembrane sensor